MMKKIVEHGVQKVFDSYPDVYRRPLLRLRELIFETAENIPEVGKLNETLKWGQPSYLTDQSKSGTTIRIDRFGENSIAVFFNCKTEMISTIRSLFPDFFEFSKNRAIVLNPEEQLAEAELSLCFEMALCYHIDKKRLRISTVTNYVGDSNE